MTARDTRIAREIEVRDAARRPAHAIVVDAAGILAFAGLLVWHLLDWSAERSALASLLFLLAALPLGMIGADLSTGVVHWAGDTFFREDTPVLGPRWVRPFRDHHTDPLGITRHRLIEVFGNTCWLLAFSLLLLRLAAPSWSGAVGAAGGAGVAAFAGSLALSNCIHRWAHHPAPPVAAAWLQRAHLFISPSAHARHHDGRFDRSFCVTTGWCNPALDRAAIFPWIEARLARLGRRPGESETGETTA